MKAGTMSLFIVARSCLCNKETASAGSGEVKLCTHHVWGRALHRLWSNVHDKVKTNLRVLAVRLSNEMFRERRYKKVRCRPAKVYTPFPIVIERTPYSLFVTCLVPGPFEVFASVQCDLAMKRTIGPSLVDTKKS